MDQQTKERSSVASSAIQPYVMILDQSAHLDWDWIRSFGQNFWYGAGIGGKPSGVQTILDQAIANLQRYRSGNPAYYYTVCEMSFLREYVEKNPHAVQALQGAGDYFQIISGGITSPDCQVCGGEAFIRNYLVGHVWLSRALPGVPPRRVCWIPDDFGQGPELPVLLQALGFMGVGFARLPGTTENTALQDDLLRKGFDFLWQASDGSQVIAHWVGALYAVGDRLAGEAPAAAIEYFLTGVYRQATQTPPPQYEGAATPAMYIPIDDDFSLPVPNLPGKLAQWSPQDQKTWNLQVETGTFDGFVSALLPNQSVLEVRTPYNGTPYWTGYYASRPELKILHYAAMRALVAAEIIAMMTQPGNSQLRNMLPSSFWDDMAGTWDDFTSSTHHDYICGTASDSVYATEQLPRLQAVAQRAKGLRAAALNALAANTPSQGDGMTILIANSLGFARQGLAEIENVVLPGVSSVSVDGGPYTPVQISAEGGMLFQTPPVPSFGYVGASLSTWQPPQAGPVAAIAPPTTGASRYVLRNDLLTATVGEDANWGLVSVIDNTTGDNLFGSAPAPGNRLVFYQDGGNIYQFGNEAGASGSFNVDTISVTTSGPGLGAVVLESGPLRVRLRTTVLVTASSGEERMFTRDYTLIAGEPFLRMSTTGAAPLGLPGNYGYSVMTLFSLASDVASITHGTAGHWTDVQPLDGLWSAPVFRATHDFLIPRDRAGQPLCAIYHHAVPAWSFDGQRDLIGCLLRNTPVSGHGAGGTDPAPHTQHYALRVPSNLGDPSTAEPLCEALAYNTPLQAVEVPAGDGDYNFDGMVPAKWKVASVETDATAILTVAKPGSFDKSKSKLILRLYQPSNASRSVQVRLGGGTPSSVNVVTAAEARWEGPPTPVQPIVNGFKITMNAAIATVEIDGMGLSDASHRGAIEAE